MLNVIHLQCIMEDFSTVKYKHSNTMYVPCAVYSHFIFQPSPINTVPVMFTIHCYTCFATLRIQSNELNQSYMCPLPETAVTCDSHDTDGVWLISPWYNNDTSHMIHMIQMLSDTLLPDTESWHCHMWHIWYKLCVTPFYLIQTWPCHNWNTWYRHRVNPFYLIQSWHCHNWHTCYRPGPILTGR